MLGTCDSDSKTVGDEAYELLKELSDCVNAGSIGLPGSNNDRNAISLPTKVAMDPSVALITALNTSGGTNGKRLPRVSLSIDTLQKGSPAHNLLTYFKEPPPSRRSPSRSPSSSHSPNSPPAFTEPTLGLVAPLSTCPPTPHLKFAAMSGLSRSAPRPTSWQQRPNRGDNSPRSLETSKDSLAPISLLSKAEDIDTSNLLSDSHKSPYAP